MMMMFFGDSHSRQFQSDNPGTWAHVSFSGATMKGLRRDKSKVGHSRAIRTMSMIPVQKTVFIMLGQVDMDVTFYRDVATRGAFDETEFFTERAMIYRAFADGLLMMAEPFITHVCILGPQVTTLDDDVFGSATAALARVPEEDFKREVYKIDCSHVERCRRAKRFNDIVADWFSNEEKVSFHRIDNDMVDENYLIRKEFIRPRKTDHHARNDMTLPLWQDRLQDFVPRYKHIVARRHAHKLALAAKASAPAPAVEALALVGEPAAAVPANEAAPRDENAVQAWLKRWGRQA
ncbi:hypothetical protein CQW49_06030 [Methylosinus trichosporium OB3b]|uniref:Uncharacterized protein n=2 Tax=Methylocystaceae TaxID=31993 RepID=A0A2D2CXK3_METT3|nr:hypothetical protein CQW49_06030 [Methylosinus trichosporium OB3b]OBS51464.1 hypothetical protein A8B73_16225 [Methylosinus sp. 3S-1]